jgi:hypothetical protein
VAFADESEDNSDIPSQVKMSKSLPLLLLRCNKFWNQSHNQPANPKLKHMSPATNISLVTSNSIHALPEFAQLALSTTSLPTLYSCLGSTSDPFMIDADMVKAIQEIIDLVYPDVDYTVIAICRIDGGATFHVRETPFRAQSS